MFSVDDINEMQKTIERKDRIIKVLKERVRQWVKEYNILDFIIEAFKISENEANEIITELKAENECLKQEFEIESLTDKTTGETIYRSNVVNKLKELLELRIEDLCESCGASSMMPMPCTVYKQTLQEIRDIAENIKGTNTALYMNNSIIDATARQSIELQARFISTLITKAEEE